MRDVILYAGGQNETQLALLEWSQNADIHDIFAPDYHRLQVERFIFDRRTELGPSIMDVGQSDAPRRWLGDGYFTFGLNPANDVQGDLLYFGLQGEVFESELDSILCTEVLEHCANPVEACRQMHWALKDNGRLIASAPFCWPDHHTDDYPDYWRFTEQAWRLMLKDFAHVEVHAIEWTDEGKALYDLMRRFEGFGFRDDVTMTTGYIVEAFK